MGIKNWYRKKFYAPEVLSGGMYALFSSSESILKAAIIVKASKYTGYDCFTPFPVHGLDEAMGVKRSRLPWVAFFAGILGAVSSFYYQYWNHSVLWKMNIGGKDLFTWPAYIPITFEMTILFSALFTVAAFLVLNSFPNSKAKILNPAVSQDKFALLIPSSSNHYDEEELKYFLESLGAEKIEVLSNEV